MASSLSDDPETRRGERHGWNSLDDYLWQHERRLDNYSSFVEDHKFSYEVLPIDGEFILYLHMQILCRGSIKLTVDKLAEIRKQRRRKVARTIRYAYNASSPQGNILRYDNAHIHPGHTTKHHKHIFNGTGHQIAESPFHIGEEGWPNMHEVIEELIERSAQSN